MIDWVTGMADRDIYHGFTGRFQKDFRMFLQGELPSSTIAESIVESIRCLLRRWAGAPVNPISMTNLLARVVCANADSPEATQALQQYNSQLPMLSPTARKAVEYVRHRVMEARSQFSQHDLARVQKDLQLLMLHGVYARHFHGPCLEKAPGQGMDPVRVARSLAEIKNGVDYELKQLTISQSNNSYKIRKRRLSRSTRPRIVATTPVPLLQKKKP